MDRVDLGGQGLLARRADARHFAGPMPELGKALVLIGVFFVIAGLVLWSGVGRGWLGQLPGDIRVDREGFSLRFPIVTCVLLSVVLSVVMWLFRR